MKDFAARVGGTVHLPEASARVARVGLSQVEKIDPTLRELDEMWTLRLPTTAPGTTATAVA